MNRVNLGAILGCLIGGIIAFILMGAYALIPFTAAIFLYTRPDIYTERRI